MSKSNLKSEALKLWPYEVNQDLSDYTEKVLRMVERHLLEVAEFELEKHRLDIDGPIDFFNGANEIVRALKSYCGRD